MSKIIINIFGAPTSGKSTIVELLQKKIDRLYTVDFDIIKHQISGYSRKRDSLVAQEITYDTLESVAQTGLQITVLLPKPKERDDYERIAAIANSNGYRLLNIELFAPEEVLMKRYVDRLQQITDFEARSRMKTVDEFTDYIRTPYYKPSDTITFDSSENDPGVIFDRITGLIHAT